MKLIWNNVADLLDSFSFIESEYMVDKVCIKHNGRFSRLPVSISNMLKFLINRKGRGAIRTAFSPYTRKKENVIFAIEKFGITKDDLELIKQPIVICNDIYRLNDIIDKQEAFK